METQTSSETLSGTLFGFWKGFWKGFRACKVFTRIPFRFLNYLIGNPLDFLAFGSSKRYPRIPFRFLNYFIGSHFGFWAFGNSKRYVRIPFRFPNYFIANPLSFRALCNSKRYSREFKPVVEFYWTCRHFLELRNLQNKFLERILKLINFSNEQNWCFKFILESWFCS